MIRVDVKGYCEWCCDFEADVTKPEKIEIHSNDGNSDVVMSDTIIRCRHARRCETIKRYLDRQLNKGDNKGDNK